MRYTYFPVFVLVLAIVFAGCAEGIAADYYVDGSSGDDSYAGTQAQPWETLTKACNTAEAGDTVLVRPGTYNETLRPAKSGTPGNLITFKADAGCGCQGGFGQTKTPGSCLVILNGQDSMSAGVDLQSRYYIRIDGFEIRNYTDTGIVYGAGTPSPITVCGCEIANNYIHDIGNPGTDYSDTYDSSKAISGDYSRGVLIENNEIYRIGGYAMWIVESLDIVVRGNTVHYCGFDGIAVANQRDPTSPSNILIESNRLYDSCYSSAHQFALRLWGAYDGMIIRNNTISDFKQLIYIYNSISDSVTYGSPAIQNVQIYGNVLFNDKYWRIQGSTTQGIFVDGISNRHSKERNICIHSNTFGWLGNGPAWIFDEDIDGLVMLNNIFYEGSPNITAIPPNVKYDYNFYVGSDIHADEGSHSIKNSDPQFVNYTGENSTAFDFHLNSTSPAIDKGDQQLGSACALPASFVDIDNIVRPQQTSYDIGAYEFKPPNRPPVLAPVGNNPASENSMLSFTISATDADGDTLTYSVQNLPDGATFTDQTFTWTPGFNQAGSYQVTFTVSDGQADDSETITITVSNTNRPPVLAPIGNNPASENSMLSFTISATDADGDTLTYSVQNLPDGATFTDQTFTWTPGFNQAGSYQVTFTVSDGQADDSETITITVSNTNRPPVLTPIGSKSTDENMLLAFTISATDLDGDTLTYSAQNLPTGATFANLAFNWTPGYNQAGSYEVTFAVSDGQADDSETITITVSNTNRPPNADAGPDQTVTDSDNSGAEQVVLNGSGSSDPDGSIISYVWTEGGRQIATGVTPTMSLSVGQHTITLKVTDSSGLTDTDIVIVTVEVFLVP